MRCLGQQQATRLQAQIERQVRVFEAQAREERERRVVAARQVHPKPRAPGDARASGHLSNQQSPDAAMPMVGLGHQRDDLGVWGEQSNDSSPEQLAFSLNHQHQPVTWPHTAHGQQRLGLFANAGPAFFDRGLRDALRLHARCVCRSQASKPR